MKNKQHKRVFVVLMTIFTLTLIGILLVVNILNVNANYRQQRRIIRDDISFYGIRAFCGTEKTKIMRSDYDYSTSVVLKNKDVVVLSNNLENISDKEIIKKTKALQNSKKYSDSIDDLIYIVKTLRSGNTVYIFVNNTEAMNNSKSFLYTSLIIFILLVLVFSIISYFLSKWIIRPSERAIKSQKEFIANISHDLKTPITIIKANADLIEDEVTNKKGIKYIRQESNKLNNLVNEMLTLAKIDNTDRKYNFSNFNLSDALLDIALPFESVAYEKHITFNIDIKENIKYYGEETQIQKLAEILLDNAISYTNTGGNIDFHTKENQKNIVISVTNTGKEISNEKKEKIFNRFYRENTSRGNSGNHYGLGLSIAGTIVEKHSGKITVESKNGKNTFKVVLPK